MVGKLKQAQNSIDYKQADSLVPSAFVSLLKGSSQMPFS